MPIYLDDLKLINKKMNLMFLHEILEVFNIDFYKMTLS